MLYLNQTLSAEQDPEISHMVKTVMADQRMDSRQMSHVIINSTVYEYRGQGI